ncbi:MAG: NAD(+) synthase, partial [Lachnospiraceae bacterium]|nr:NAD(+) synthase [Lachnospiraceae bacterium]
MKYGFVKVGAASPDLKVAQCEYNVKNIKEAVRKALRKHVKVLVFPELAITGYTCSDLFLQDTLLKSAVSALLDLEKYMMGKDMIIAVGVPLVYAGKLYNTAAVISGEGILGIVPKMSLPNYAEFYEMRHFTGGYVEMDYLELDGRAVPFGTDLIFACNQLPELKIAVEICEDLWVPETPGTDHALAGATVLLNLSASDETIGKAAYRRELVKSQSARLVCAYIYADAGDGESTTDMVFSGHDIISENGTVLAESGLFEKEILTTDIDVKKLAYERRRMNSFNSFNDDEHYVIGFDLKVSETKL